MFMTDRVPASNVRRTGDGYLVADVRVARGGNVQDYLGSELGRPDMSIVRVYRPAGEVFTDATIRSFAHRPVTNDHPAELVTAETWKDVAIGQTGDEILRDGEFVRVPLVLMDAAAIKAFESGKRELSMGYTAEIVFGDGVTPDGQPYDAIQTQIKNNHLALVDRARGGDQLRIGDDTPTKKEPTMTTKTILVDGLSVETTDAGIQAITKLQQQIKDGETALSAANTAHTVAIAAKDAAIAKIEAERDDLKGKVLTDAQLDARVNARADLVAAAKAIANADYSGKSDAEIRKAAVVAKLGDAAIKDKADAYIEARFDILADAANPDPVRAALRDGVTPTTVKDNGYAASVAAFDRNKKEA